MRITRYGLTLQRLRAQDAELVRQWRNDSKISRFMFYKGEITPAMQQEWFTSIDNEQNFFFLIEYHGETVGLINISSIDWEERTAYTGLFIYNDAYLGSDVPVSASLAMLDVFFLLFNLQVVYAKVKGDNPVAHKYNTCLGFARTKKIELGLGYEYMLQKEVYLLETKMLRNASIHLKGNKTRIELDLSQAIDKWVQQRLALTRADALLSMEVEVVT